MGHLKLYLFALLAFLSITEGYSKGYYLDNKNNVVEIPLYKLPLYLRNESVMGVATYFPQMNKTGWHFLQVSTNKNYPDYKQMYAAGFLEGSLTYDAIWDAWNNFNEFQLNNESQLSPGAQAFVNNQTQWLREIAERRPEDDFWELVNSTFTQQIGMYDGYIAKIKEANRSDMHLSFDQLYFLTNMGDLEDIIPAYNISAPQYMECSALIRLAGDDIIIAHNTFNLFSLMLRVFKSYTIPLNNPLVKVKTLMFSSRPGDLESKDDFYVLDSRLVVLETSLNNYNRTLYEHFSPKTLPSWLRHLVANRMATDGNHWAELFFRNRSGTHNNQWLVVDYNKLEQYKGNLAQAEGIVTMVEEFYNLESAIDVTQELLIPQGYVAGYNVPYNKSIYDESGYAKNYSYNYSNDPRAVLFRKYAPDVKDVNSAKHLIRHNNPKDTNDICSAISPRCDLLEKGPYIFGAIDGKVTNKFMVQNMLAWVVSGPTNQNHPAFDWSKWPNTAKRGMPTVFNFDWLLYRAQLGPFIPHNKTISE